MVNLQNPCPTTAFLKNLPLSSGLACCLLRAVGVALLLLSPWTAWVGAFRSYCESRDFMADFRPKFEAYQGLHTQPSKEFSEARIYSIATPSILPIGP